MSATRKRALAPCSTPGVADLPAALRIERSGVEHDLPLLAGGQLGHGLVALQERDDIRLAPVVLVAGELGAAFDLRAAAHVGAEPARRARTPALLLHGGLEARLVDREPSLAGDVGREIDREAVGVVELEDGLAGYRAARQPRKRIVEQRHALRERLGETLLLLPEDARDVRDLCAQLRVSLAHHGIERRHERVEEGRAADPA